ncbi:hypothetical protein BD626DRAFT_629538 [Schizophyllum amplum]|uniref:Uncharacterized protein n=1 Tax=Schizophyllum amplum TaxID=97359 RepID=A0A550CIK8_9AGAR|nr:hypothetical protein BD626DRAFT_629538 [Auriculariopsis ampla]
MHAQLARARGYFNVQPCTFVQDATLLVHVLCGRCDPSRRLCNTFDTIILHAGKSRPHSSPNPSPTMLPALPDPSYDALADDLFSMLTWSFYMLAHEFTFAKAFAYWSTRRADKADKQLGAGRYYGTLRQCLDHDSLTRLHVSTGRAAGVRSARLFADLRVFKNISTAVIYVNHDGADLDSALESFTAAWPSLTHLHFVNRLMDFDEVTLEGLVPLATRCPALELLEIPLDTHRPTPKPVHLPKHQALLGRRMELEVQRARAPRKQEDIDLMVDFLASVFPAQTLRFIAAFGIPQKEVVDDDEWWQIFDKVWKLCKKRMQSGTGEAMHGRSL